MSSDFIQIKSLEGDLKMSHKKKDYGLTITTKELILHKPHMNYYFKLEKIISIVPYEISSTKAMSFVNARSGNQETTHLSPGTDHFRIYVQGATVHNRSGLFELGPINIVIPIYPVMLGAISECLTRTGLISL